MSGRSEQGIQDTIPHYLTRLQAEKKQEAETSTAVHVSEITTPKMATGKDVTNAELHALICKMNESIERNFAETKSTITKLTEKVDSLEHDVKSVQAKQDKDSHKIALLEERVDELQRSLLLSKQMSRKYNLIIHGVKGYETNAEATIKRVRAFATETLDLDEQVAKNLVIRNAHRLQKREEGETPIIVAFLKWCDRDLFLSRDKTLRGTGMRITPDLPPELEKIRAQLVSEAAKIREHEKLQTRIKDKGVDFWIETREDSSKPWVKRVC